MISLASRFTTPQATTNSGRIQIPIDCVLEWLDVHTYGSVTNGISGTPGAIVVVTPLDVYDTADPAVICTIGWSCKIGDASGLDPVSSTNDGKFLVGLGLPLKAGQYLYCHCSTQAGCPSFTRFSIGIRNPEILPKSGHVVQVTSTPNYLFAPRRPKAKDVEYGHSSAFFDDNTLKHLNQIVVTGRSCFEICMDVLGQIVFCAEVIKNNQELFAWDPTRYPEISGADFYALLAAYAFPVTPNSSFRQLMFGLSRFGKGIIESQPPPLDPNTGKLGAKTVFSYDPNFRLLETGPREIAIVETVARALSQDNPRRLFKNPYRRRTILAENPE